MEGWQLVHLDTASFRGPSPIAGGPDAEEGGPVASRGKRGPCVRIVKCSSVILGGYGVSALCFATVVVLDPKALYAQKPSLLALPILVAGVGVVAVGVTTWGARRCYLGSRTPEGTCMSLQRQRAIKTALVLLAGYGVAALGVATIVVLEPKSLYEQQHSLILIPSLIAALALGAIAISTWGARRCYQEPSDSFRVRSMLDEGFI